MNNFEKVLIVLLIFTSVLAGCFYKRSMSRGDAEELNPLDSGLVSWFALLFVFGIFCAYIYLGENKFTVPENIGQIGDFIGGLTNPVLSFLALLVLLRTTSIQTGEARKTTAFMQKQQSLLEKEKFENTFFQLLAQLEAYCDKHFRVKVGGADEGIRLSEKLRAKSEEFNALQVEQQRTQAKLHISDVASSTECTIFYYRALRVVKFVDRSSLSPGFKRSYANILRDTIYPDECIVLSSIAYQFEGDRALLKEWGVVDLVRGMFVSEEVESYYLGNP